MKYAVCCLIDRGNVFSFCFNFVHGRQINFFIMIPQYTYDNNGNPVGVFIPINDWNSITEKYADIEDVPEWEKNMIDQRLAFIKNHPDQLIPIADFIAEIDQVDEL